MKIAIVGAGLSGLTTAIALRKYVQPELADELDITIYDTSHTEPSNVTDGEFAGRSSPRSKDQGAAISLQSNGLKVLRDLNPGLAERVKASGFPCKSFTWKTAAGWILGYEYLDLLPISRPALVQCLQDFLPNGSVVDRPVIGVVAKEGLRPVIQFQDGGEVEADFVVGADGIGSVVRKSLFGKSDSTRPKYLGHCAVGGVMELDQSLPEKYLQNPSIVFVQGAQGVFGYCGLAQADHKKILYFSFYDSTLPQKGEKPDPQDIKRELLARHENWNDEILERCLNQSNIDNVWPIFYLPDLPSWGRDGCVLVGDAAHAVTPVSGQGGSQGFEDSQTLALLLKAHLKQSTRTEAINRAIGSLFEVRHKRVYDIKAKGLKMKEPDRPWSLLTTLTVYSFFFVMTKFKSFMGMFGFSDPVLRRDAQDAVDEYVNTNGNRGQTQKQ